MGERSPLAGPNIDRRAMRSGYKSASNDIVGASRTRRIIGIAERILRRMRREAFSDCSHHAPEVTCGELHLSGS
jgi:hypothetical protein